MFQTIIMYHSTDGINSGVGYTYKKVWSQEEKDRMIAAGWFMTVTEMHLAQETQFDTQADTEAGENPEQIEPEAVELPETATKPKPKKRGRKKA